jgi:protein involved in polysaccharide export with SLBB domain
MRKAPYYLLILLWALFLPGFAHSQLPQTTPTDNPPAQPEMDMIHFGDLIDIDVIGSFEFDWRGTINPEGFLAGFDKIPEHISALCKSEEGLAAVIAKEYGKILRDPRVVVKIIDRSNRPVSILQGAVKTPQRFQIKRPVLLNELLIVSGGLSDRASGEIQIFRSQNLNCFSAKGTRPAGASDEGEAREKFITVSRGNGSETLNIRIIDLLSGNKQANPEVLSGDIITVMESPPIYIIGGVNSPKQISSRAQTSLSRAIASAGGLAKEGLEKVVIFRREGRETRVINADLKKIKAGQEQDIMLQAYDIVDVAQKGKEKRNTAPMIEMGNDPGTGAVLPLRIIE